MTRNWLPLILVALATLFLLFGCSEEAPAPPPAEPQKVAAPAPPVEASPSAPEAAAPPPPKYVYNPSGRRDPFEPLTMVRKSVAREDVPLTPLQTYDLGQLRLIGVIVGKGEPRAMVSAPDGKSYILKKGIKIGKNDGVVVGIKPEAVLVEERYYDFSGIMRKTTESIQLPKREGVE
jgi:type IV pilus assembly protein PilP